MPPAGFYQWVLATLPAKFGSYLARGGDMLDEVNAFSRLVGFREIAGDESKRQSLNELQAHIQTRLSAGWNPFEQDVPPFSRD